MRCLSVRAVVGNGGGAERSAEEGLPCAESVRHETCRYAASVRAQRSQALSCGKFWAGLDLFIEVEREMCVSSCSGEQLYSRTYRSPEGYSRMRTKRFSLPQESEVGKEDFIAIIS